MIAANTNKEEKEKATFIYEWKFDPKEHITKLDIHQDPQGLWSGGIGATVWDAGIVLSKYLEANKMLVQNKTVLEIGSGTGLVGMVCAKLGAKSVLFTDKDCALPLLNKNVFENFHKHYSNESNEEKDEPSEKDNPLLLCTELTWGDDTQMRSLCNFMVQHFGKYESMFDVIILSDCICWKELHEPLIGALQSIVTFIGKNNKNKRIPSILMSYEIRKNEDEQNFFEMLTKLKWEYKQIQLDSIHDQSYVCDELPVHLISPNI